MESDAVKFMRHLYRLLDAFPESDPLTVKLKERSLVILEQLAQPNLSDESCYPLLQQVLALEEHLAVAKELGWVRGVNRLILEKGFAGLKDWLSPRVQTSKDPRRSLYDLRGRTNLYDLGGRTKTVDKLGMGKSGGMGLAISDDTGETSEMVKGRKHSQRQKRILDIVSGRDKTQVSDIVKELPNVTKRTIRRDLDRLMAQQAIFRFGEWNRVFYRVGQGRTFMK